MKNRLFLLVVLVMALVIAGSVVYTQAKNPTATAMISADQPAAKDAPKDCPKAGDCAKAKEGKSGCCDKAKETKPGCCDKTKQETKSCPGSACKGSPCEKNCPAKSDKK